MVGLPPVVTLILPSRARSIQEYSFQFFEAFLGVTATYLLNSVLICALNAADRRLAVPGLFGRR
jgi:glutamate/aspartate transport system permease protein